MTFILAWFTLSVLVVLYMLLRDEDLGEIATACSWGGAPLGVRIAIFVLFPGILIVFAILCFLEEDLMVFFTEVVPAVLRGIFR